MTQAKHTHGEWYARAPRPNARAEDGDTPTYTWTVRTKYEAKQGGKVGHEICEITHINTGHEEADARLIAAAKELLEALQGVVGNAEQSVFEDWFSRYLPSGDSDAVHRQWIASSEYEDFCIDWLDERSAIAKATGA